MIFPCRLCAQFEQDGEALRNQLQNYIESLNAEMKVDNRLYEERLGICESCEAMHQGLCKYCGCFVIVRAIKKQLTCPNPMGRLW